MIATDAQLISFAAFSFSFFQSTSCVSKPFNFQCSVQRVGGSKAGLHRERKRNKKKEDQAKQKQVAYVRHAEKQGELLVNLFVLLLFACPLYHTYTHKTTPLCPHFLSLTLTVLLIDATDVHREINNLPAPPTPTPPQITKHCSSPSLLESHFPHLRLRERFENMSESCFRLFALLFWRETVSKHQLRLVDTGAEHCAMNLYAINGFIS